MGKAQFVEPKRATVPPQNASIPGSFSESSGSTRYRKRDSFVKRHAYDFTRDLIIAILALLAGFTLDNRIAARQDAAEDARTEQQEILETLRFVRDRAEGPTSYKPFQFIQLPGANLSGLNLSCDITTPTSPYCANLQQANLRDAVMRQIHLTGAYLAQADLVKADLASADLSSADLSLAKLSGADLSGAGLEDAILLAADLEGATLTRANLARASFKGTNVRGADLSEAIAVDTSFLGTDLTGANLSGADLSGADLTGDEAPGTAFPADLSNICYDDATKWPSGFRPPAAPECADA